MTAEKTNVTVINKYPGCRSCLLAVVAIVAIIVIGNLIFAGGCLKIIDDSLKANKTATEEALPTSTLSTNKTTSFPVVTTCVTANSLNVRSGPGLEYPIVGNLQYGDCITLIGRTEPLDWVKFNEGWVDNQFLGEYDGWFGDIPVLTK